MSNRDAGFLALGRFLAVERYCQSSLPSSTHPVRIPHPSRTGGHGAPKGSERLPRPAADLASSAPWWLVSKMI